MPLETKRWDPLPEMRDLERRVSELLRLKPVREAGVLYLKEFTTVYIAQEYTIKVELPGVNKEDVRVSVEGGVLSISGERKAEKEETNKKYHRIERTYGSFARSFTLPEGTASDKVSAEFKDGVLRVHLPKDEAAKPKSIDVKIA